MNNKGTALLVILGVLAAMLIALINPDLNKLPSTFESMFATGLGKVMVIAIVIVLIVLLMKNASIPSISWENGSFIWRLVTDVFVAFVVFLFLYMWDPTAPLFTTDEGRGHILMYGLAIAALAMVFTHHKGLALLGTALLLFFVFGGLGESTVRLFPKLGPIMAQIKGVGSSQHSIATTQPCNGSLIGPYTLSGSESLAGSGCQTIFEVIQGVVHITGPNGGYVDIGPSGILQQYVPPGWRGLAMSPMYAGTVVTRRLCPSGTTRWDEPSRRCV